MAPKPAFDSANVTVVFVLGGPGAGKGTQCARLVDSFDFCHLSAGDLLRAEQDRPGSDYGHLIRTCIREGTIVPMHVTVKLLENAMRAALADRGAAEVHRAAWAAGRGRFLIDGFPRKMDQADMFEQDVCESSLVIFYTTTEDVMLRRLLKRGETSGREDDNVESIKKRFGPPVSTPRSFHSSHAARRAVTYQEQTMPVIDHYRTRGKVAEIDSSPTVDDVHAASAAVVKSLFEA
ncbi:UMP-CMP kinase [Vararia minispora EC-137]|uniref:UMP-CMP kinase n=1 Tax=Vararia minispora EC-137 TaxID=1314806 RepID=A0ACB8Q6V7_9AGAM|nr:UMP-CMP kinase [Vararia minispora EC-137]